MKAPTFERPHPRVSSGRGPSSSRRQGTQGDAPMATQALIMATSLCAGWGHQFSTYAAQVHGHRLEFHASVLTALVAKDLDGTVVLALLGPRRGGVPVVIGERSQVRLISPKGTSSTRWRRPQADQKKCGRGGHALRCARWADRARAHESGGRRARPRADFRRDTRAASHARRRTPHPGPAGSRRGRCVHQRMDGHRPLVLPSRIDRSGTDAAAGGGPADGWLKHHRALPESRALASSPTRENQRDSASRTQSSPPIGRGRWRSPKNRGFHPSLARLPRARVISRWRVTTGGASVSMGLIQVSSKSTARLCIEYSLGPSTAKSRSRATDKTAPPGPTSSPPPWAPRRVRRPDAPARLRRGQLRVRRRLAVRRGTDRDDD